jgi:uncharacterized protein with ATP-grasp and redox domains
MNTRNQRFPPPLMTSEAGSFAEKTIRERKPQIIAQVTADHVYPPDIQASLEAFRDEIAAEPIAPLPDSVGERGQAAAWRAAWAPFEGRTWREVPWYFAEAYFYRRLLQAVRYFEPGPWQGHDPFGPQKAAQIDRAIKALQHLWPTLEGLSPGDRLTALLLAALWGNRADLSNLTVDLGALGAGSAGSERHNLVIDDTEAACAHLQQADRVAFICDNVGADSLHDLALADHLLSQGWASRVTLHLKAHPFFVSDASSADIEQTVAQISKTAPSALSALGVRLSRAIDVGTLELADDPFWNGPELFDAVPEALQVALAEADIVILKGDVNYRRLLGDRHWPYHADLSEIARTFAPGIARPFLVLRTLKGEIMVGLAKGQAAVMAAEDPTWLINGRRGIVQLVT